MKAIFISAIVLMSFHTGYGQNFSEWFRQKKTQKKYLIEQIAALRVYGGYLKKGYEISQKGLGLIGELKDGDFSLHRAFFDGLQTVNPRIAASPEVEAILQTQQLIGSYKNKMTGWYRKQEVFSEKEKTYFNNVFTNLETDCMATLAELEQVTTPGKIEMSDDQRIKRINDLYRDSQQQFEFVKTFGNSLLTLAMLKTKENREIKTGHTWYGIK